MVLFPMIELPWMVLMGYRKELPLEGVFALRFTWTEALDTAANVYHGVCALVVTVPVRS